VVATYLDRIIDWHRARAHDDGLLDARLASVRDDALSAAHARRASSEIRSFEAALRQPGLSVIAEVKRRSPSKGDLAAGLDPSAVAQEYAAGGAACLSVLTDGPHFGGSAQDLAAARNAVSLPVIRKDFTVCPGDVYETSLMSADCVLLIVAALSDDELAACAHAANEVGLDVLWETHDEDEVKRALAHQPRIIGVNQRDLHTFQVDQERAVRVAASIPNDVVKVAESGVRGVGDASVLYNAGYDAVLVGESVVTSGNRADAVRALRSVEHHSNMKMTTVTTVTTVTK
jgi:indole-3-glycerol phosphate synthase